MSDSDPIRWAVVTREADEPFTEPMPKHLPYQIDPSKDRSFYYETYWKHVGLQLLEAHLPAAGISVLDYGCGRGESLEIFGKAGYRVTGVDVDPECVKLSSKFGTARILEQPDEPVVQFGEKSFDVVICFHVLEHVDNPKRILSNLARIARKNVLVAVPNLRYLNSLFARHVDINRVNEGHLQSWDHWHLRSLAERHCGLRWVGWGFDATRLPILSPIVEKTLGHKGAIWFEAGPFRKLFPFHGISVIGLFEVDKR